jgi:isoleucyl-tRNA synthetase
VTTEDGSGIVHIAPGHGAEDYMAGMQYGLAIYSPVKDNGAYDDTVPAWLRDKSVLTVDPEVIAHLNKIGLLGSGKIRSQLSALLAQQDPVSSAPRSSGSSPSKGR